MESVVSKQNNLKSTLVDILVMAKRNILKIKHNPDKLIDVTVIPIFFMVVFSYLFGGAIAGGVQAYLPIIVPGILIQTLVMSSSATGTQLREDLDTGVFDRFKSLPIVRIAPLAGLVVSDILRYIMAALFSIGTGYILGWRPEAGIGWLIVASLLAIFGACAISWVFALIGLVSKSSATISSVSTMVTMMMSFLSNAFVPTNTLPTFLQKVAEYNPVTYLVTAFKDLANHGQFTSSASMTIFIGILLVLIIAPITVKIYNRKI
ncbi:ABC transporter permease [Paenibacillus azoreducens]|jgi:ABC-2 type transport system permease protein|uniref:Transport permease protein n=1 Tax=Paenibacillus azoreducens TaxID=116718 RepID=A0A920CT50_9BACL|nr:ABC transporter permease [Paenibacillus azoreducens]GIO49990.1 transport permease protein [Paenibacillus azoreducens]